RLLATEADCLTRMNRWSSRGAGDTTSNSSGAQNIRRGSGRESMRSTGLGSILILSAILSAGSANAADFTMPVAGHLSVILDGSGAQFHNTISIVQPDDVTYGSVGITKVKIKTIGVRALDGCSIEDSQITGAPSPVLLSERTNDFGTSPEVATQH